MTPAENIDAPGAASADLLPSRDEAAQLAALRVILPEGWAVALQAEAGMAWAAFVHDADAPRSWPLFTICRWNDCVGLFTRWIDGSTCSTTAFTELGPVLELILELILDSIFAAMQEQRATVATEGWANIRH